jgi:hypothetical protein
MKRRTLLVFGAALLVTFVCTQLHLLKFHSADRRAREDLTPQSASSTIGEDAQALGSDTTNRNAPSPCPSIVTKINSPAVAPAFKMVVNVFTYNRLDGLVRLLRSLEASDYLGRTDITLALFIDFTKNPDKPTPAERRSVLEFLDRNGTTMWSHGPLRVHRRDVNVGLKRSIMEAWYPLSDDETAAFFEDDIEVSPYWFRWVSTAITTHGPARTNTDGADRKLLGVSLFRPIFDELSGKDVRLDNENNPFILQQPCSWGAVYFAGPWRRFRNWYEENRRDEPLLDDANDPEIRPSSNSWDSKSSWKKYLIKLMYLRGWFMIYPNFPNLESLSKNHLMPGEHPLPPKKKFKLPLVSAGELSDETRLSMGRMPPLEEMQAFNVMFKRVGSFVQLPNYRTSE